MQELTGFLTPLFHVIIALFGDNTADSFPFILSSCLFLTGLLRKKSTQVLTLEPVQEGVQSHVRELASQASLGSETKQQPSHYPHENVVFHVGQLQAEGLGKQAPEKGVLFQSSEAKLLGEALENPNHQHRQRAVQLVRRFNKAVEKEKAQAHIHDRGIVIQQASQKYGISATILRDWEEMGLIPVLYKGKGKQGVYLDEEAVARAATLYQEAKQKGIQPTRFLKAELAQQAERRPQLDQGITANSAAREFNVPTNFFLRWAKELGVIPIVSEGVGAGSATYLDREKAREVAELYHEAKRQKIQPKKLLERISSG